MASKPPFNTREAAALLGVSPSLLSRAVWDGKFTAPDKGPGGAFLWTLADLERASWALRHRNIDDVLSRLTPPTTL